MKTIDKPLIMMIDSNDIDLFLNKQLIDVSGISDNIISFQSAREGLDYLRENSYQPENLPTVILLDIQMPEIDGIQFLELFDDIDESVQDAVKIIILSSSLDGSDVNRAHDNKHVVDILKKPLDPGELKGILKHQKVIKAA